MSKLALTLCPWLSSLELQLEFEITTVPDTQPNEFQDLTEILYSHCHVAVSSLNVRRVFQILNEMVRVGQLPNYAIGGAIGAVFYIEPFATQDVDVFVMMETESSGLVATIPGWDYLKERGYTETRGEAIVVEDWPVQFIPVSDALEEEAYLNATILEFEGEPVRVVLAEHLVAIMLNTGRPKDLARAEMFFSQESIDTDIFLDVMRRHGLEERWRKFQEQRRL